jgi:hypothetical protein
MWIDMGNHPGTQISSKWRDVLEAEARLALETATSFAEPPKGMVAPVERVSEVGQQMAARRAEYEAWMAARRAEYVERANRKQEEWLIAHVAASIREVAPVSLPAAAPESDYDRSIRKRDEGIARRNELMMQAVRDFS